MVQRVITLFTDDISGEQGDDIATHTFSVDGIGYEIDLGADNYDKLLEALAPFLRHGRKTGSSRSAQTKQSVVGDSAATGCDPVKVRAWAKEQGIEVSPRGRIPRDIIERYESAN
ncbi:histone-like nucleoid-structuring protein Lsr2 [Streptomyces sp. RPT161]|uniref:histone-like nucleoid-structuring protein Lsr2 n=1 Tax=Streptomyces sp. RPT161 TaxID=3015993 RepID=UPI0022B88792|nr:Lsr2 family protein [Streptomyces sp. RPT161]